jgi:hypothetical protein
LKTLMTLPMSWHSDATIISLSAPAFSASVAVCSPWTSWLVANPSVMPSSWRSIVSTWSATRGWFFTVSAPITAHSSAVDSSIRVKVVAMAAFPLG